jgi:hypothetical protein
MCEMAVESASYEAVIARYSCIYDVMNKIELSFAKQIRRFDINNAMISLPDENQVLHSATTFDGCEYIEWGEFEFTGFPSVPLSDVGECELLVANQTLGLGFHTNLVWLILDTSKSASCDLSMTLRYTYFSITGRITHLSENDLRQFLTGSFGRKEHHSWYTSQ